MLEFDAVKSYRKLTGLSSQKCLLEKNHTLTHMPIYLYIFMPLEKS